jgi:cytochrome c biogenesis protein CcmG/thiol:disulfide interchange protein DsbE
MFNDTPEGARAYRRELGGDWPLLQDPKDRAAVDFGVTGPPETFVVDDAGIVVQKIRSAVGPGQLEEIFAALGMPPG